MGHQAKASCRPLRERQWMRQFRKYARRNGLGPLPPRRPNRANQGRSGPIRTDPGPASGLCVSSLIACQVTILLHFQLKTGFMAMSGITRADSGLSPFPRSEPRFSPLHGNRPVAPHDALPSAVPQLHAPSRSGRGGPCSNGHAPAKNFDHAR